MLKKKVLTKLILSAALLLAANTGSANQAIGFPSVATLAERRADITFPQYSDEEKQLVADQANLLLSGLYVNRYQKMSFYSEGIDAAARMEEVVDNAVMMDDEELHFTIQDIFSSQRDLHLNYYFPAPYQCFQSQLPLSFVDVLNENSNDGSTLLVVESLKDNPVMLDLAPELNNVQAGDVLVSYNGKNVDNALEELVNVGSGANLSGGKARAIQKMTFRFHLFNTVPAEDVVQLTLRRQNGETYQVALPWIVQFSTRRCNPQTGEVVSSATSDASISMSVVSQDDFQLEYSEVMDQGDIAKDRLALIESADPILSYGIYENNFGRFGYILFTSFVPERMGPKDFVVEFARVLREEMAGTDGLIVDVRQNGGGYTYIADALPQLFSATNVDTPGTRFINTELNWQMLNSPVWSTLGFNKETNKVHGTDEIYTPVVRWTPIEEFNKLSQAYFGQVAIFTDASCYSSCDLFSATMQDNGLATIWSEDNKTGAGGANVWTHTQLGRFWPGGPFRPMPAGQDMRVSHGQAVRVGEYAGHLIEDWGVIRDDNANLTHTDFLSGGESQLKRITSAMKFSSWDAPKTSSCQFPQGDTFFLTLGDKVTVPVTVTDTEYVELELDGATISRRFVGVDGTSDMELSIDSIDTNIPGKHRVKLVGTSSAHEPLWRVFVNVQVVKSIVPVTSNWMHEDFADDDTHFAIETLTGGDQNGWNIADNVLRVGDGQQYVNGVNTTASMIVDVPATGTPVMGFYATVQTEETFDFFNVYVIDGDKKYYMDKLTGNLGDVSQGYSLADFAGKIVEVGFEFTSDQYVTDVGVSISAVVLGLL